MRDTGFVMVRRVRGCALLWLVAILATTACGASPRRNPPPTVMPDQSATADVLCDTARELFMRRDYAAAAEHFDRCSEADPGRAYAYYRAGLAYYEMGRTALMVTRFETFVKMAPDAPERPQVESILATVRR